MVKCFGVATSYLIIVGDLAPPAPRMHRLEMDAKLEAPGRISEAACPELFSRKEVRLQRREEIHAWNSGSLRFAALLDSSLHFSPVFDRGSVTLKVFLYIPIYQ